MGYNNKEVVYKNDPTLPRMGKGEFAHILLNKEMFQKYIKENKEYSSITYTEFCNVWILIAEEINKQICENPLGVKLPFFLGELKIQYLPYKKESEDVNISKEVGESVGYSNIHSKGKVAKLIWERKATRRYNKSLELWAFEPAKLLSDKSSVVIKNNPDIFRIARTRVNNIRK